MIRASDILRYRPDLAARLGVPQPKRPRAKRGTGRSSLEKKFIGAWRLLKLPELVAEYRFHPVRRWRFDFAHVASKVGIEIHGGTWIQGRHQTGTGFTKDREKVNTAVAMGWAVFELTAEQVRDVANYRMIAKAIEQRTAGQPARSE